MDNLHKNLTIFVVVMLLVLYVWSGPGRKKESKTKLSKGFHYPTLIQLYQDENEGVAKFVGQGVGVPNQLLTPTGDLATEMDLAETKATYGSTSIDLEKDGYSDLIVTMEDGIWIYKNNLKGGQGFSKKMVMKKKVGLTPVGVVVHDFDRDGNLDLYVMQVDDQTGQIATPILLRHMGQYEFVDVTSPTRMQEIIADIRTKSNGYLSDVLPEGGDHFIVKMPNNIEFASARVVLVSGLKNRVKYNLVGTGLVQNSTLIFALGSSDKIDKVKIRTIYGKEYNYAEQEPNGILIVEPMPHFESSRNIWRSTSMG